MGCFHWGAFTRQGRAARVVTAEDYRRLLRSHWLLILISTLIGGAVGLGISLLQPKVYTADSQNFVAISSADPTNGNITAGSTFIGQRIDSYGQLASSPDVLQPVIDELQLPETVSSLSKLVKASNPAQTVLIDVTATYSSAEMAANISNSVSTHLAAAIEKIETPSGALISPVKVSLTDPAVAPAGPSSPKKALNLLLGLMLGLGLSLGYVILRATLDTTVRSDQPIADITGAPSLGIITFDKEAPSRPLAALDLRSPRAEAMRVVRTNLQYIDVDNPPKSIVVTSAVPGEGKTTTIANLAIAMALAGKCVIIIDGDLRQPKVAKYFGVEGTLGITNLLAGQNSLHEVIVRWGRGLVYVMPAGPIPPNPSEVLGSGSMGVVISFLTSRFDVVLIDAPPLLPVTDAAVLARQADGAILVVRDGKTTTGQLEQATEALQQVNANLLGTIRNFVPMKSLTYGYGYGDGEGETQPSERVIDLRDRPGQHQLDVTTTPVSHRLS